MAEGRVPVLAAATGLMLFASAAPGTAATVAFSGTRQHINILNPPFTGRCVPTYIATVDIVPGPGVPSSTGMSNLGAFQSTQSHCISPPLPTTFGEGLFSYAFEQGDVLEGSYFGEITLTDTPEFFDSISYLTVTGGTGRFLGASGTLIDSGSFLRGENPEGPGFITDYSGTLEGVLNLPAVPEPATWAFLIAGFGLVGATLRRRRTLAAEI